MHKYRGVFRFMVDTRNDLEDAAQTLDRLLNREFAEDSIQTKGRHRQWHDIDPTMPEALFEQAFIDCYGRRALDRVIWEFPVIDMSEVRFNGRDSRSEKHIQTYQAGRIQFLATCSLLNEGWDSPRTSVIVMARPTMSKVLYTQQLGRGTRTWPGKESLYVIDVVDNYVFTGWHRPVQKYQ